MQIKSGFSSIEQVTGQYLGGNTKVQKGQSSEASFLDILTQTRHDIEESESSGA